MDSIKNSINNMLIDYNNKIVYNNVKINTKMRTIIYFPIRIVIYKN